MKLTSAQVERTLSQFEAQAIPDDHPVVPQLNSLFGEHTFFLDSHGLNIVEPAGTALAGSEAQQAKVVNVANWSDGNETKLEPHEPEPTDGDDAGRRGAFRHGGTHGRWMHHASASTHTVRADPHVFLAILACLTQAAGPPRATTHGSGWRDGRRIRQEGGGVHVR